MATDRDIEIFIGDSFTSIWDLELLTVLLAHPEGTSASDLIERMRSSESVVSRGIETLVAAGMAAMEADGRLHFRPVNEDVKVCAVQACDFYARFPGRARRLIVARQAPGLNAFADAFRLRKD